MSSGSPTRDYAFVRYFPAKGVTTADPACLARYHWLSKIPAPRMVCEAVAIWQASGIDGSIGIAEAELTAVRHRGLPSFDPVPNAALIMAVIARRARKTVPEMPQCALNWTGFGSAAGQPRLGDIICSLGEGGAWVGLYVGEDDVAYHCLGVTADDRIGVARVPKHHLVAVRRPLYEGVQYAPNGIRLDRDGVPDTRLSDSAGG